MVSLLSNRLQQGNSLLRHHNTCNDDLFQAYAGFGVLDGGGWVFAILLNDKFVATDHRSYRENIDIDDAMDERRQEEKSGWTG